MLYNNELIAKGPENLTNSKFLIVPLNENFKYFLTTNKENIDEEKAENIYD